MKKIYLILALVAINVMQSQTLQWAKSGGSNTDETNLIEEKADAIAVDPHSNVYVLSSVFQGIITVGGQVRNTNDYYRQSLISSFSCNGTYRWSKNIGGHFNDDIINGIGCDNAGNLYAVGYGDRGNTGNVPMRFDTDTIMPQSNLPNLHKRDMYLVKYDSIGQLKKLIYPQMPNFNPNSLDGSMLSKSLAVDAAGNCYWLCYMWTGLYDSGALNITQNGNYILKYNSEGIFQQLIPIDIETNSINIFDPDLFEFKRDPNNGHFYFMFLPYFDYWEANQGKFLKIGGNFVTHNTVICSFDQNGNFLWKQENMMNTFDGSYSGIGTDNQQNVYITRKSKPGNGWAGQQFVTTNPDFSFNGLVKFDVDGNLVWMTNSLGINSGTGQTSITSFGNTVTLSGPISGLSWGSLEEVNQYNGSKPYIITFDQATGTPLWFSKISTGNGNNDFANCVVADHKGNYFVGGAMQSELYANGETLVSNGGNSDFFVAKIGSDDCSLLQVVAFDIQAVIGYPNPIQNLFYLDNTQNLQYVIFNMLGKKLGSGLLSAKGNINFENYNSGLYLLQLQDDKGAIKTIKVMKK